MEEEKAPQIENPEKISIPDFKEYEIDRNGNVFRNGKLMKQQTNTYGYKHIHLCIGGKVTTCLVHRLVAMAFIPNDIKMNKEEFQTKKNDIDSKIRELKNQKIQLEKEYIESNQGFPVGSKVCITVLAHERYIFGNNERILVPGAKKLAYIADYEIDDNGEVVPSLRQLDYNGGMSAIPLFVNLKKDIIELA